MNMKVLSNSLTNSVNNPWLSSMTIDMMMGMTGQQTVNLTLMVLLVGHQPLSFISLKFPVQTSLQTLIRASWSRDLVCQTDPGVIREIIHPAGLAFCFILKRLTLHRKEFYSRDSLRKFRNWIPPPSMTRGQPWLLRNALIMSCQSLSLLKVRFVTLINFSCGGCLDLFLIIEMSVWDYKSSFKLKCENTS